MRWRAAIADATGLVDEPDDGELLIRLRKAAAGGWEVLLRLTPVRCRRAPGAPSATKADSTRRSPPRLSRRRTRRRRSLCRSHVRVGHAGDRAAVRRTGRAGRRLRHRRRRDRDHEDAPAQRRDPRRQGRAAQRGRARPSTASSTSSSSTRPGARRSDRTKRTATLYPALLDAAAHSPTPTQRSACSPTRSRCSSPRCEAINTWHVADQHRFFQKGHWPRLYVLTKVSTLHSCECPR